MSTNRTILGGNLTRDPEEKRTQGGLCILEMGLAVNERRKSGETGEWEDYANFIECVMFGKRAEAVAPYLHKGDKVVIDGKLRQERWEKDGQKRSKIRVIVDDIDFSGGRRRDEEPEPSRGQQGEYDEDIPF